MRTTITLEDDLGNQLREISHRMKKPFKVVVNEAIRRGLGGIGKSAPAQRFRVQPRDCGLRPGFDERRWNQLLDEMELSAAADKLRKAR